MCRSSSAHSLRASLIWLISKAAPRSKTLPIRVRSSAAHRVASHLAGVRDAEHVLENTAEPTARHAQWRCRRRARGSWPILSACSLRSSTSRSSWRCAQITRARHVISALQCELAATHSSSRIATTAPHRLSAEHPQQQSSHAVVAALSQPASADVRSISSPPACSGSASAQMAPVPPRAVRGSRAASLQRVCGRCECLSVCECGQQHLVRVKHASQHTKMREQDGRLRSKHQT